jgi:hypothetical protein
MNFFSKLLLVALLGQTQAMDVPASVMDIPAATAILKDYAPATASLFNNMKVPASIIGGAMVGIGFAAPLKFEPEVDDGPFAIFLRRSYPFAAVLSLCSELIAVMWATVAVNQLTETKVEMASSVWDLIQRDFEIPWVATNAHFVLGMLGFMWVICSKAYFLANKGALGASAAGLAWSSMLLITSIVNRGIAAGGGDGAHNYGSSVLALFKTYSSLFFKRAFAKESFGPLEVSAAALALFSLGNGARIIIRDVSKEQGKFVGKSK